MRHGATASQSSLETERMNRVEMCLAAATPAGAGVRPGGVLRELAGAPVSGDGQLSRPPADALVRVACSLPEASVLSLGGVSRALFALGHADPVWRQLVERDYTFSLRGRLARGQLPTRAPYLRLRRRVLLRSVYMVW